MAMPTTLAPGPERRRNWWIWALTASFCQELLGAKFGVMGGMVNPAKVGSGAT